MQPTRSFGRENPPYPSTFTLWDYLRQLPVAFSWWTLPVLLEAGTVLLMDAHRGYILPLSHYFIWAGLEWYSWALLTPFILNVALHYPIDRTNWPQRILFPHALMALACVCIQAVLHGVAGSLYSLVERPATPFALITESFDKRGLENITAYCLVVATAAYLHLREEVRLRQLREAQLEARLASAQLEMLRMQLQPHFLFNTLQAAITLVQEDPRAAEDMLHRLSQLLRVTLDEMGNHQIPLSREFDLLDLYIGIQRVRFSERLTVNIHAAPNALDSLVPTLLLQPLVETPYVTASENIRATTSSKSTHASPTAASSWKCGTGTASSTTPPNVSCFVVSACATPRPASSSYTAPPPHSFSAPSGTAAQSSSSLSLSSLRWRQPPSSQPQILKPSTLDDPARSCHRR